MNYAGSRARESALPFVMNNVTFLGTDHSSLTSIKSIRRARIDADIQDEADRTEFTLQWRLVENTKQELLDQCIAYSIMDRGPPANT